MKKKIYHIEKLHEKLQAIRKYRGFTNQTKFSQAAGFSRQLWNLWETGKRLPDLSSLCTVANFSKIDIRYFFSDDVEIRKYDFTIKSGPNKEVFENTGFVKTKNIRQTEVILLNSLQKKCIYIINADFNTGITRFFQEYKIHNPGNACILDDGNIKINEFKNLNDFKLIMIDNAEKLIRNEWLAIFDFYKNFKGSIIIAGKNIRDLPGKSGFENYGNEYYTLKSITIREFEDIIRIHLPDIDKTTLNLIKFQTNQELKKFTGLLFAINEEMKTDQNFKLSFKTVFNLCAAKMIFL